MLIVLIHGAYTEPWHWGRLIPELEAAGHDVVAPRLPIDDPRAGIEAYVEAVEAAIDPSAGPPLLVGSSFGAVSACVIAARREVHGLATVCGLVPEPGRSTAETAKGAMHPAYAKGIDQHPDGTITLRPDAACAIAFDGSAPEVAREAASHLRPQGLRPFAEPCPIEAMPKVPRRGITAADDRMVRAEWQADVVRDRLGVEPTVLPGDHTPMLSQPARLAELLLEDWPAAG